MCERSRVLITGSNGFIASHLVDGLLEVGHSVIGFDNFLTGNPHFWPEKATDKNYKFVMGSIVNVAELKYLFKENQINYIFHLAADARIPSCTKNPVETTKTNVMGTLNLLKLAVKYHVKGFCYSSSSSIYGEVATAVSERDNKNPASIYAVQKLASENMVTMYHRFFGLPTVNLRYFNVYGTNRQSEKGAYPNVFAALCKAKKNNETFHIFGDGECRRDYVHVYDVVKANMMMLNQASNWTSWGCNYNIGTGKSHSVNEVLKMFGYENFDHIKPRREDVLYSCADIKKAEKYLGFKSSISLEEGIKILKKTHGFT